MLEKEPEYKITDGEILLDAEKSLYIDGLFSYDARKADELISDSLAKSLLRKSGKTVYTKGRGRAAVSVDSLCKCFKSGELVDVNRMKEKGLISDDVSYVKIRASGEISKPLFVYASDFTPSAVKMIALSGGEAIRVNTVSKKYI